MRTLRAMSADDEKQKAPPPRSAAEEERALRDAEARALAESGLGSGLLARQSVPLDAESVAVLKVCPQCGREYETAARFCPLDGTALRPKGSDSLVGRVLADRYHILKRIGEGGMGRVYLGEHVKMNRQCAIKVMSPSMVNDSESAARFAREASNAARIIHPNVAAVFDFGESDGLVYLVMEFVDGEPLSRLLSREAPLSLERAIDLTRQIADGLGAAHEIDIVHRDLKPDNILIMRTRAGREIAKVVDFGIAKAIQEGAGEGLTRTGQVIGTPEFMSPEQLVGDPVDARTDLYSLGCILHLMLTGAAPFSESTREQMIKRRLSEDAPSVQVIDPGIPASIAKVVARLLARTPAERYGSSAELRDALSGNLARRSGVEARPHIDPRYTPRSAPTVAFLQATQATTEVTPVPRDRPVRRRTRVVAGAAVAVAGVAVALVMRSGTGASPIAEKAAPIRDTVPPATVVVAATDSAAHAIDTAAAAAANAAPPPVVSVDTVRFRKKREADSTERIANADVLGARAALSRYARAIASADIAAMREAYPAMNVRQQDNWEKAVFARADKIDARVRNVATHVTGDSADADFSLALSYFDKLQKQTMNTTLRQRAKLTRKGKSWQIVSLQ
ncbi:MAG TPA: protein kinase [Gemmatimonadaceae bacterium]